MAKLETKSNLAVIHVQPVSTLSKPSLEASKPGCVKVRLSYFTTEAKHLRSLQLGAFSIQPPYTEEVFILLPQKKVFALLENFLPSFEYLQKTGVVSKTAELQGFRILVEDETTLSYLL